MRAKVVTVCAALIMSVAVNGYAQFGRSTLGLGTVVGVSKLQGDIEKSTPGLTGGLMLRYTPIPYFAMTTTAAYGKMTSGLNAVATYVHSATLAANLFILPYRLIDPFISVGVARIRHTARYGNNHIIYDSDHNAFRGWETALQFGLGLELATSRSWALNTLVSYNRTNIDGLDGIIEGKNDGFFRGMIGLVRYFSLGKNKDLRRAAHEFIQELPISQVEKQPVREAGGKKPPFPDFTNGIRFLPGTADLQPGSAAQLDRICEYLAANPTQEIELLGKSSKPSTSIDYGLVVERAHAIKNYLVGKGISAVRIIIAGQPH